MKKSYGLSFNVMAITLFACIPFFARGNEIGEMALKKAKESMSSAAKSHELNEKEIKYKKAIFYSSLAYKYEIPAEDITQVLLFDSSYKTINFYNFLLEVSPRTRLSILADMFDIPKTSALEEIISLSDGDFFYRDLKKQKSLLSLKSSFDKKHKQFYFSPSENIDQIAQYVHKRSVKLLKGLSDKDFLYLKGKGTDLKFKNLKGNQGMNQLTDLYNHMSFFIKNDLKSLKDSKKKKVCQKWEKAIISALSLPQQDLFTAFTLYSGILMNCDEQQQKYNFLFRIANNQTNIIETYSKQYNWKKNAYIPLIMTLMKGLDTISVALQNPDTKNSSYDDFIKSFRKNLDKINPIEEDMSLDDDVISIYIGKIHD